MKTPSDMTPEERLNQLIDEGMPPVCRHCGAVGEVRLSPGVGPHFARMDCFSCGRFMGWLAKPVSDGAIIDKGSSPGTAQKNTP